ncbi:MAG: LysM peptidoglycan-binding domain-containing protein [Anaerolineales bacterium]|nr:LysM peptidoglycan-binding domain-containing protein [Anaerolineales bacterium]
MPVRPVYPLALALAAALSLAACYPSVALPPLVTAFVPPSVTPSPVVTPSAPPAATDVPGPTAPAPSSATPPAPTPAAPTTPPPTVTLTPVTYVVVAGDVFLNIAARFNLTAADLLDANPGVDPDHLQPGDVLVIPDPATLTPAEARVKLNGGGLRVRAWPSLDADVAATLPALTRVDLLARTADNDWVQLTTLTGLTGWVPALWLDLGLPLADLPVGRPPPSSPTAALSSPRETPLPHAGYVANVTLRMLGVFQYGQVLGNRARAFSKVGDSITVSTAFLAPVGRGSYTLGPYTALQPVIDWFLAGDARDGQNSFVNVSLAAKVGWRARGVLSIGGDPPPGCAAGETPLACEYRVVRPAVAVIMFGTNDVPYTPAAEFDHDLRAVLDYTLQQGVIPIVSTIPPFTRPGSEGRAEELNTVIRNLAFEYALPLVDYYESMATLPDAGLSGDGVHPNTPPDTRAADFTGDHLLYGTTMRNLTTLYALAEVWDKVMQP